jgi:hypothetical protein
MLPQDGSTALHMAAARGALPMVQFLLAEGADIAIATTTASCGRGSPADACLPPLPTAGRPAFSGPREC